MISRVESFPQLFILDEFPAEKIYPSTIAMAEHERLKQKSLEKEIDFKLFIISCNVKSLPAHFLDIISSPYIVGAEAICLQETWLLNNDNLEHFAIEGFTLIPNSVRHGRGIVTYVAKENPNVFQVTRTDHQMTIIQLEGYNLLNIYRSSTSNQAFFLDDLLKILDLKKKTLLVGDLNICRTSHSNHPILELLNQLTFKHNVTHPTHRDGHLIDYASHFCPNNSVEKIEVRQCGQYFTDHNMMIVDTAKLSIEYS